MRYLIVCLFLLVAGFALPVRAQQSDPMEEGILAFRAGQYEQAVAAFERALKQDPDNAEIYFLLARIYFETPLRDTGKAGDYLEKALEIEPDNVKYLVARLEQLRVDSWNFLVDKVREQQRRDLARKILQLDPDNAYAHEELGRAYIRDFWRYRNAFMFPAYAFQFLKGKDPFDPDPTLRLPTELLVLNDAEGGSVGEMPETAVTPRTVFSDPGNPNRVFLSDQFDVEALKAQGVPVQDLSQRAQRAYDLAIGHLYKALESDPRKREVYDDLMHVFALRGDYQSALEMLQQMYVYFPEDPQLWTYLGLAHYRTGNMVAAAKAFQTAFTYMDPEMEAAYTRLDDILPESEREKYREDPVGYAARFWTSKDPRYLTPYNERKLEHYARLTYADLLYGSPKLGLRGWDTERGRILVRYGIPQRDVIIMPRQLGLLRDGLSDVAVNQSPAERASDPTNPQPSPQLLAGTYGSDFDVALEANTFNVWDYGEFRFVFEDPYRNGEFRLFSPEAKYIATGTDPWLNDYERLARETFRKTPERYAYTPPGRQVELPYLVATFKGSEGTADLYVSYGVPITQYDPATETINLTAQTGTFLVSGERDMLAERRRTLYGLRTAQIVSFAEANLWVDSDHLEAPPGRHEVSVEFETSGGSTVAVQRREVVVPDYASSALMLSDVMLAYRIEEAPDARPVLPSDVVRNGLSIQAAPWSVFSHEQPIYLYFEIYNLAQDETGTTHYEIEAELGPKDTSSGVSKFFKGLFGGGDRGVSVRLPGEGRSSDDYHYLILDASNQEPGLLYTLHLKVKDRVSGREVSREMDLYLE